MGPSMLERLKALGPARVQKIALRLDHDETPSCMLTLYNGEKLHVGFLGSESYCENTPCEQVSWSEAKPSKSQAAFRHHLLNTELTQAQINQGAFVFNFKRYLVDLLAPKERSVASLGNAHLAEHLAHDHFDVLVVNRHTL